MLLTQNKHLDVSAAHSKPLPLATQMRHTGGPTMEYSQRKETGRAPTRRDETLSGRRDETLSGRKTGRRRNVWKHGGGAGETGKMHKILGRDESLDGDEGRDEGGTGSGPVAVGGEAGWAARG